jgi:hypothetical protein
MPQMMRVASADWAIWHIKAIGLPRLLDDLERLERTGFPEEKCKLVRSALTEMIRVTDQAEDSFWRPCVSGELQQFLDVYIKWNSRKEGADLVDRLHRRQQLEQMRLLRKKMSGNMKRERADRSAGAQQDILGKDDYGLGQVVYEQLKKLAESDRTTFKILKTAVDAFEAQSATIAS